MTTYTFQEAFNKAYNGVIAQGEPSFGGGSCLYRGPNGRKCAVGHLLDDDKVWRESSTPASPENYGYIREMFPDEPGAALFLESLQAAHDDARWDDGPFIHSFKERMRNVADAFGLEVPQ